MADSASTDRFVPFRGALRAALGQGAQIVFVTVHPEGQPTAVYRLDVDKAELGEEKLPGGGAAIVADDAAIYVAGTDGHVYKGKLAGGALAALGPKLDPAPIALALLEGGRLAALSGSEIVILDRKSGAARQRLPLPDAGTALAADATGKWLAAGTARGVLAAFDAEDKDEFLGGESAKIHEGSVTALLFDPDEPRVFSTGSDGRLWVTHVRGALEPEDRTGGSGHEGPVPAIALGPEDKLYTAGQDGTIKTWTRGPGKRRPSTLKDGVARAAALARVEHKGRPHLALLGEDATIRLFPLDAGGKIGERALTFRDAYALAENEFAQKEPSRREAALKTLAGYDDARAIDLIAERASGDPDAPLRVAATKLLGATRNPRAVKHLEELLGAAEENVRLAALAGLRAHEGDASLRPLELALGTRKRDVGVAAVTALAELAAGDDQAMDRLVRALDDDPVEVRAAAVASLEAIHDARVGGGKKGAAPSPEAHLVALRSKRGDIRRMSLVRAYQRKLLGEPEIQAALRRHEGDADADVRRAAFLVSVMSRPALAAALRARDRDLHRQLWELENLGKKLEEGAAPPELDAKEAKEAKAPKGKKEKSKASLPDEDLRPLFEAMASRALDTCLAGARGLASLQDERAFGTLLQLTNEREPAARVEACKAIAELGDVRGDQRLRQMLRDGAGEVRDAAFTALARLEEKSPLRAAEAGLAAEAADVRGRGLGLLVRLLKKDPPKNEADPAAQLLERALNDTAPAVRTEAFKAALSMEIAGGGVKTLRFALRSVHADVRREVLGEVMGRIQEAWAPGLLHELFADPDAGVRNEAFDFSQKRTKGKALEPLAAALSGRHADLKLKAIDSLAKRRVEGTRELLVKALGDDDEKVRLAAVSALGVDEVAEAMESPHADVRAMAATARASVGDAKALAPLLSLVTEKEPDLAELRTRWADRVVRALGGLAELGASGADVLAAVNALIGHKEKSVRDAAARALGWVSTPGGDLGPLKAALTISDEAVKTEAALGLALVGDSSGLPLLRGLAKGADDRAIRGLAAALALGEGARDLVMAFLDHNGDRVRGRALLVMMLLESSEQDGVPDRCLAALSSAHPRVRLAAARALEAFSDPAAFQAFVVELFNDRGDDKAAWAVPAETVRAIAEMIAHGDPQLRARAARVLDALDDDKPERFERTWDVFRRRFGAEIERLGAAAAKRKPAAPAYAPEELRQIVLGAYAGLSRMGGGALEVRVRQTALARLAAMAREASLRPSVIPLILLALGDPNQAVRKLAFDSLAALGVPAAELGAEALAVGHRDMGVAGLKLLAEGSGAKGDEARRKVLEQIHRSHTDWLEEEAAKLLAEIVGWPAVHEAGLEARSQAARERAVAGLAEQYDASEPARKALRRAIASRYRHVRERAAIELAGKKDPAAFDALVSMLRGEAQAAAIDALVKLGDDRTPGALLDRIDDDPAGTALTDKLFEAASGFRLPAIADRLLRHLEDKKRRRAAFDALVRVSGYDQPFPQTEDEPPAWAEHEARRHPRRDDVLARTLDAVYRLGDADLVMRLLPAARWSRGKEVDRGIGAQPGLPGGAPIVDQVLAPLAASTRDDVRNAAVEAIGFRLRKRGGPAEPLVAALSHANPLTQFVAAEGLALGGRAEGIRVLLTSIDLVPELDQRRRAVRALGRLGDARSLDPLLRLVNEEGHALQEEAAEAIGHLRETPKGKAIEDLLLRLAAGSTGVALAALTGLRWFGSRAGWELVRGRARDPVFAVRQRVAAILADDPSPASRDALIERVEQDNDVRVARQAAESLRRLEGPDSLEPDYVLLRARARGLEEHTLERLRDRGDPGRILDEIPRIQSHNEDAYVRPLVAALLARDPAPLDAAAARLGSVHDRVAAIAAQILARGGKAAAKAHGKALVDALKKAHEGWVKVRKDREEGRDAAIGPPTERYRRLVEAAGKLAVGADEVIAAASLGGEDPLASPVRMEALLALASGFAKAAGIDALAAAVQGGDARQRELAASALQRLAPERAASLAPAVVDDRTTLDRLLGPGEAKAAASLRAAAAKVHTQGVALPHLVAAGDVEGLAAALADRKAPEAARLGAIEALAKIASAAALERLAKVAASDAEDEEIRKAAWRALRRGRRYEQKRAIAREVPS